MSIQSVTFKKLPVAQCSKCGIWSAFQRENTFLAPKERGMDMGARISCELLLHRVLSDIIGLNMICDPGQITSLTGLYLFIENFEKFVII